MNDRKILYFVLVLIIYCLYCALMWYSKSYAANNTVESTSIAETNEVNKTEALEPVVIKKKVAPLYFKDFKHACSIIEVFTVKPTLTKGKKPNMDDGNNTLTVFGITIFLMVLVINAIMDVMKVKEEEKMKMKMNPDGGRRQSLAEFANKRTLRRESSKFGLHMFQIGETSSSVEEKKKRQARYTRGDSTNSYLSEKMRSEETRSETPKSLETPTGEPKLMKRQSVAKIFGARPAPLARRSSFPVLPLNPDIQALMLGGRRPSTDSDDEDGRGKRVRIIRRY